MRNFMIFCLILFVLTACGTESANISTDQNETVNTEQSPGQASNEKNSEAPVSAVEPEENEKSNENTMATDEVAAMSRFIETFGDYTIYIFSDDEVREVSDMTWAGASEGDQLYSGEYQFAVAKNGDESAVIQDHIDEQSYLFNDSQQLFIPVSEIGFALLQFEATNIFSFDYFELIDGKLQLFESDTPLTTHVETLKKINNTYLQTMNYSNGEPFGYSFSTYEINADEHNLVLKDEVMFADELMSYGFEMGKWYKDMWLQHDDYYVSFHDLSLEDLELGKVAKGYLFDSAVKVTDFEPDVKAALGVPFEETGYEGGILYGYNNFSYVMNPHKMEVVLIMMDGRRLNSSISEVIEKLGEPDEQYVNEMDGTYSYNYHFELASLRFETEVEGGDVIRVSLWKNK